jgi:tryptophanyl-tRNA synthetase
VQLLLFLLSKLKLTTMARILTGIQCTGRPHLGNILGAMQPTIKLSQGSTHDTWVFLADLHTLTTVKDPIKRRQDVYTTAAAWLALGLNPDQVIFYRQSKIPVVCELTWYLSCLTPYPMLANAHAFKDKSANLAVVSAGLFTYPVLMAADILLYQADIVPVGKDQVQHLEITRDIAHAFNHQYGETFTLPKVQIEERIQTIPGIDGRKMSKSYQNTIDIFLPEKQLRQSVMAIQTDSTPLKAPKDPDQCIVFKLYSLLADSEQIATMRSKYLKGGYGYGDAKQAFFELILKQFTQARRHFDEYMHDLDALENLLATGEAKAQAMAMHTIQQVRSKLGY